jgi:hypothetical protein
VNCTDGLKNHQIDERVLHMNISHRALLNESILPGIPPHFCSNWVIMGIQWMVRWWVLVQGGVFVIQVSSSFPWQDLDEGITRIQSARELSPLVGAVISVMPLSWGITLHITEERLWWDFDSFLHFFGPFELQRTAKKQIQPSQNHHTYIYKPSTSRYLG